MKIHELLPEVFNISKTISSDSIDFQGTKEFLKKHQTSSREIAADVFLGASAVGESEFHFLENSQKEILGWAKTSPKEILNKSYTHLDFILVRPEWTGTNALKLLLYGIKETLPSPLVVDGALFQDGQRVMLQFLRDESIFRAQVLNKRTGETREFTGLVNDPELCYVLLPSGLGFGQQFMPESVMKFTWFFSLRD
jgi:hypothetical protein